MNIDQLILAFGTILLVARVLGWVFQRIGQPRVIGEMTAGILLGPSVFGRFFPAAFHYVLPPSSFPAITVLSQLGLLLFMFVVGLEVDLAHIFKQRAAFGHETRGRDLRELETTEQLRPVKTANSVR